MQDNGVSAGRVNGYKKLRNQGLSNENTFFSGFFDLSYAVVM